jgi:lysyl endopeptidase
MFTALRLRGRLSAGFVLAMAFAAPLALASVDPQAPHARYLAGLDAVPEKSFGKLDLDTLAAEDTLRDEMPGFPKRFAVARPVDFNPSNSGEWSQSPDGDWIWRLRISAEDAAHLNFGFRRFALPPGAELNIVSTSGLNKVGPFTVQDMLPHGQLWTPVVLGEEALLHLRVPSTGRGQVTLEMHSVNQGYRGFGSKSKACKSGACNTDVACLSENDPWNLPRRSVGAWSRGGTDACTGSLVNNTANDRRMLFATATHCGVANDTAAATVLVYWNYESPTCRVPAASGSSPVLPKPSTTTPGLRFLAQTGNPFSGSAPAGDRSDFTLLELATPAPNNTFNLYWAGWDRRAPGPSAMLCSAPSDPASTAGLCASIHHPGVDEKRITFVEQNMVLDNISGASGVHWRADWDPTPPRLPNITPMPATLPPSVTEPGSSGSPLYNAEQRLVGVLSGGPSACGATGANLRDQYGGLFHAWDGLGSATTRVRDYLDPLGQNPQSIDGIGNCNPPAAPTGLTATATAANQISLAWTAVGGISTYRVLRSIGTCPGSGYVQIAEVTGATTYVDNTVSGGSSYVYQVVAFDAVEECPSAPSACASATATGTCALPPSFAGLTSATSAGTASCGIALSWPTAVGNCGTASSVRYNVYRGSSADFTPAPANLLESCISATALADIEVESGVAQHYIVRAEDLGATPAAGQCNGVEETNLIRRSAAAFGPDTVAFSDDVESGPGAWAVAGTGAGANFAIVSTAANSPTRSWFVAGPAAVSDRSLSLSQPIALQAGTNAVLEFAHRRVMESGFDGGVLEYSIDGGTTWVDILAGSGSVPANANRFLQNGYVAAISTAWSSPIGGRQAWSGTTGTNFVTSRVALADFGGQSMLLRFRYASDSSVGDLGWWIDDVRVSEGSACEAANLNFIFAHGFEGN